MGKGLSIHLFNKNSLLAALASFKAQFNSRYPDHYRLGPELQLFVITKAAQHYKTKLGYTIFAEVVPHGFDRRQLRIEWGHSLSLGQQSEIRLNYLTELGHKWNNEIKLSFLRYY